MWNLVRDGVCQGVVPRRMISASGCRRREQYVDWTVGNKFSGKMNRHEKLFGSPKVGGSKKGPKKLVLPLFYRELYGLDLPEVWEMEFVTWLATSNNAGRQQSFWDVGMCQVCEPVLVAAQLGKCWVTRRPGRQFLEAVDASGFWTQWWKLLKELEEKQRLQGNDFAVLAQVFAVMNPPEMTERWEWWVRGILKKQIEHMARDKMVRLLMGMASARKFPWFFCPPELSEVIVRNLEVYVNSLDFNALEKAMMSVMNLRIPVSGTLTNEIYRTVHILLPEITKNQMGFLGKLFLNLPYPPPDPIFRRWEERLLATFENIPDTAAILSLRQYAKVKGDAVPDYFLSRWVTEMIDRNARLSGHELARSLEILAEVRVRPPVPYLETWGPAITAKLEYLSVTRLDSLEEAMRVLEVIPTQEFKAIAERIRAASESSEKSGDSSGSVHGDEHLAENKL